MESLQSLALPNELIRNIFRFVNSDIPRDVCSTFVLCQVCRHWRVLSLSMVDNWTADGSSFIKDKKTDPTRNGGKIDSLPVPVRLRTRIDSLTSLAPWLDSLLEIDLNYVKCDDARFNSLLRALRAAPGVSSRLRRLCTPFDITKASLGPLDESIKLSFPKLSHLHINGMRATAENIAKGLPLSLGQLKVLELGSLLIPAAVDGLQFLVLAKTMPKLRRLRFDANVQLSSFGSLAGDPTGIPDFSQFLLASYPRLAQIEAASDVRVWHLFWRLPPFRLPRASAGEPSDLIIENEVSSDSLSADKNVRSISLLLDAPETLHTVLKHSSLEGLESLVLSTASNVLFPISLVSEFKHLQVLRLNALLPLSPEAPVLSAVADLPKLDTLALRMREPWKDLTCLGLPSGLTSLALLGDQGLTSLVGLGSCCPQLVSLSLLYNRELQGRDECHHLSELLRLTHLSFSSGRLDRLQSSTELENPTLSRKTATAIAALGNNNLSSLDLSGVTLFKPATAAIIGRCTRLRRLILNYATIGLEALEALKPLRYQLVEVGVGYCSEVNSLRRGKEAAFEFLHVLSRTIAARVERLDLRSTVLRLGDIAAGLRYEDFPVLREVVVTDHQEFKISSRTPLSSLPGVIETEFSIRYEIHKVAVHRLSPREAIIEHQSYGNVICVVLDGSPRLV